MALAAAVAPAVHLVPVLLARAVVAVVVALSVSWYLRGRKCLQRIPQAWFLWVLVQAVLLGPL